jgi:TetR/AcrR family transcriptional regulator, transcriptional repressor for nem operon
LVKEDCVGTSKQDKERNHETIVAAASALARSKGLAATTVNEVMSSAGLTHGGFYAHFASRDRLLSAAVARAFTDGRATMESLMSKRRGGTRINAFISIYLSRMHIAEPSIGCAAAALAVDVSRSTAEAQDVFVLGVAGYLEAIETDLVGADQAADDAALVLSALVGAVALSRAMGDNPLAAELPKRVETALNRRVVSSAVP